MDNISFGSSRHRGKVNLFHIIICPEKVVGGKLPLTAAAAAHHLNEGRTTVPACRPSDNNM